MKIRNGYVLLGLVFALGAQTKAQAKPISLEKSIAQNISVSTQADKPYADVELKDTTTGKVLHKFRNPWDIAHSKPPASIDVFVAVNEGGLHEEIRQTGFFSFQIEVNYEDQYYPERINGFGVRKSDGTVSVQLAPYNHRLTAVFYFPDNPRKVLLFGFINADSPYRFLKTYDLSDNTFTEAFSPNGCGSVALGYDFKCPQIGMGLCRGDNYTLDSLNDAMTLEAGNGACFKRFTAIFDSEKRVTRWRKEL